MHPIYRALEPLLTDPKPPYVKPSCASERKDEKNENENKNKASVAEAEAKGSSRKSALTTMKEGQLSENMCSSMSVLDRVDEVGGGRGTEKVESEGEGMGVRGSDIDNDKDDDDDDDQNGVRGQKVIQGKEKEEEERKQKDWDDSMRRVLMSVALE